MEMRKKAFIPSSFASLHKRIQSSFQQLPLPVRTVQQVFIRWIVNSKKFKAMSSNEAIITNDWKKVLVLSKLLKCSSIFKNSES